MRRLNLLKELLQQELKSKRPSLTYVEDLQLSIERAENEEVFYQMVENAKCH